MSEGLNQEIPIEKKFVPEILYHLVPEVLFTAFVNERGDYDCRGKLEWGMGSEFIHTTTTKEDLRDKVANNRWREYVNFLLLKIETEKLNCKFTRSICNGTGYFHIWSFLPSDSYTSKKILMGGDGKLGV